MVAPHFISLTPTLSSRPKQADFFFPFRSCETVGLRSGGTSLLCPVVAGLQTRAFLPALSPRCHPERSEGPQLLHSGIRATITHRNPSTPPSFHFPFSVFPAPALSSRPESCGFLAARSGGICFSPCPLCSPLSVFPVLFLSLLSALSPRRHPERSEGPQPLHSGIRATTAQPNPSTSPPFLTSNFYSLLSTFSFSLSTFPPSPPTQNGQIQTARHTKSIPVAFLTSRSCNRSSQPQLTHVAHPLLQIASRARRDVMRFVLEVCDRNKNSLGRTDFQNSRISSTASYSGLPFAPTT